MIMGVPYDAEIEYLESTGEQWIDTGIKSSYDLKVSLSFEVGTFSGEQRIFGQSISDVYRMGFTSSRVFMSSGNDRTYSTQVVAGNSYTMVIDGLDFYVNGTYVSELPNKTARGDYNCYLFAWNRSPLLYGNIKARRLIIESKLSGTKLQDFIPVRVGQVGYMYDRVTRRLFGNAGTGAFVLGPDVARPVMGLRHYPQIGGAA